MTAADKDELAVSLLEHGAKAVQAAVRLLPDAQSRRVMWAEWVAWREGAPVLLPDDHMPWEDVPDPLSPGAQVASQVLCNAVQGMFGKLYQQGSTPDDLASAMNAFPREMDKLETRQPPVPPGQFLPRCRSCGARLPRQAMKYCNGSCRKTAWRDMKARERERDRQYRERQRGAEEGLIEREPIPAES